MLILSRRKNEEILLPGLNITIKLLDVRGNTARIGIEAPIDVKIYRHENTTAAMAAVDQTSRRNLTVADEA